MLEDGSTERIYQELRRLARCHMRRQPRHHSFQVSDLVNEAWLGLAQSIGSAGGPSEFRDEAHLLATAAWIMRNRLVDRARRNATGKHKPPGQRVPYDDALCAAFEAKAIDLVVLHELLNQLEEMDPIMATAVNLRFFGFQSLERTAELVGMSPRTFDRRWSNTRDWIQSRLK